MKFKTTKKEVNNGYSLVLKAGYCDLQHLLNYQSPVAYVSGAYGWNADIYNSPAPRFGGTAIVTGYRPFGFQIPYDLAKEYDEKAEKILMDYHSNDNVEKINKLIWELIEKCRDLYIGGII